MSKKKKIEEINLDGQILPYETEIEQVVLGSVLLEGDIINKIIKDFTASLFYNDKNKIVAESIIGLYKENKPIDIITICNDLKQKNKLEEIGGAYYISSLTSKTSGGVNLEFHVKILQQKSLERNLVYICNKTLVKILNYKDDIFDVYSNTQVEIDSALKEILTYEIKEIKDIHFDILERNINVIHKGIKSGIPSGFRFVDNVTNGWQKSDLIILAGRPSMGKTATAVSMIIHPAIEQKIPVAIFSLEMSNFQLGGRIQSYISGVNVSKIIKGQLNMDEVRHITSQCSELDKSPLFIDDTPNISLLELKSKARKLVREKGVQLIVIDYLQLMKSGLDIQNREQEIAEISRGLKALAKELNIPVIALSQLSRLVEARSDKKPMLSDLRESGQIEQDADMVVFCYRPEYYGIEQYEVGNQTFPSHGLMMLLIAKHRNGELGEIPLRFIHEQAKLDNYNVLQSVTENNNNKIIDNSNKSSTFVTDSNNKPIENNTNFLNESNSEDLPF
jgi:replicative DNA helicase